MDFISSFGASLPTSYTPTGDFSIPADYTTSSFLGSGGTLGSDLFNSATAGSFLAEGLPIEGIPSYTDTLAAFGGGGSGSSGTVWNFVVAPEDVSWDIQVATQRVDIFGTNSPPVTVGTKGMRNLNLGNAMIEGFTRARTVEGRVIALEDLTKFTLDATGGFVNVPVYQVFANQKIYGDSNGKEGGYFVISDVRIKETMRDFSGKSTRAFAEISLVQVPKYQVNTGRDQASKALSGATATGLAGGAGANQGVGKTTPAAGQSVPPPAPPTPPTVSPAFAQPAVA